MVLLRLKINLRHIQEVNVSTHTRVIISNKRMNEENISIYEVGTKGRINWTEVCNSMDDDFIHTAVNDNRNDCVIDNEDVEGDVDNVIQDGANDDYEDDIIDNHIHHDVKIVIMRLLLIKTSVKV